MDAARRLPTLAVVEDDRTFREDVLLPVLTHSGFSVVGMTGALELYRSMTLRSYDLVLLDIGLPDEDGFSIAAHLRRLSARVGIVMLTGYDSGPDRMRGLRAGADAYLPKPVDMEEVVTTLHNLARWVVPDANPVQTRSQWRLDERGWCILAPSGVEIEMNLAERQVMAMLAAAAGVPVQRETLIARLVKNAYDFDPHRLEMLVHRLRKKCQRLAEEELPLRAVRGIGYVLNW
ncbi:response regulator transcription factor [Lysobacter capsici]|uniref:response regulator transcription factor n=1 Tax=Lysobacter capsici TaxID=435897 RepID=UPI001C00324A|nr:response regulator transcription factor [Lysobacter capsici]QWF16532.1 response regulator transcription factor [Lysobacter capsici]